MLVLNPCRYVKFLKSQTPKMDLSFKSALQITHDQTENTEFVIKPSPWLCFSTMGPIHSSTATEVQNCQNERKIWKEGRIKERGHTRKGVA